MDGTARVWDLAAGSMPTQHMHSSSVYGLFVGPCGNIVVSIGAPHHYVLWSYILLA